MKENGSFLLNEAFVTRLFTVDRGNKRITPVLLLQNLLE